MIYLHQMNSHAATDYFVNTQNRPAYFTILQMVDSAGRSLGCTSSTDLFRCRSFSKLRRTFEDNPQSVGTVHYDHDDSGITWAQAVMVNQRVISPLGRPISPKVFRDLVANACNVLAQDSGTIVIPFPYRINSKVSVKSIIEHFGQLGLQFDIHFIVDLDTRITDLGGLAKVIKHKVAKPELEVAANPIPAKRVIHVIQENNPYNYQGR